MTKTKLTDLIDEAIHLDREIEQNEARLKHIKSLIVEHAEASPEEQTEGEGGGKVWTAQSSNGELCRVSFPIPSLKPALKDKDKALPKARELCGKFFEQLFKPELVWKPVQDFRDRVHEYLERREATALIKACSTNTTPKVSFETKEKEAA
jgi:hypothetical protein